MGKCRLYRPGTCDAQQLDRLIGPGNHAIRLAHDRIIVSVNDDNEPTGCLVWTPSAFIHQFNVPPVLGQRSVANSLYNDAVKIDIARRHLIRTALWMVDSDNLPMLRYARDVIGATEQKGIIFTLQLKLPAPGDKLPNESNGQAG